MAKAEADIPGAPAARRCAIGREAVLPLLDGAGASTDDAGAVVYVCEEVDVAMDSAGQRFVACAHPTHGHAPQYADLARRMASVRRGLAGPAQPCVVCGGSGWLPLASSAAHQQHALMRAIGYFRGLPIPQLERAARLRGEGDGHPSQHPLSGVR